MLNLKQYSRLHAKVEGLRRQADEAAGEYKQLLSRLREEFGVQSVAGADKLHRTLTEKATVAEEKLRQSLKEFQEKYPDLL